MHRKYLDIIDENVVETVVHGLRVYHVPKKGFKKSYAILTSDFGSKDITFSVDGGGTYKTYPEGIAHFLEHKVFEMPEGGNIFNRFADLGASVNAFTNNHQTSYHFSTTEHFGANLELLLRMVMTPHLTPENVEKEKGIIAEEIRMYDDNPAFKGYIEAMKALYHVHPVRDDIAGTVESILELTPEDLMQCYEAFYHPANMILVLVGDLELEPLLQVIRREVPEKPPLHLVKKPVVEPESANLHQVELDMSLQVPNYIYAFKAGGSRGSLLKETLLGSLVLRLVFGSTSDFYETNLQRGTINDSFSADITIDADHGEIFLGGESRHPEKELDLIEEYIQGVHQEVGYFEKRAADIERIKKSMTGSFFGVFNSVDRIGTFLTGYILKEKPVEAYVPTLKALGWKDVEAAYGELFQLDRSARIIVR